MKKVFIVAGLLVMLLFLTSCGPQELYLCPDGSLAGDQATTKKNVVFICPDGTRSLDYDRCEFIKPVMIDQEQAGTTALSFVEGHVFANGWNPILVNVNLVEENWQAQIVISKYEEISYETSVLVDGESGFATCTKNCQYIS